MCKFCENQIQVETILPEDNQYGKLDSSVMIMLGDGCIRLANPDGRTWKNNLPIFQFDVLFCPYCGKRLKSSTNLTTFNGEPININSLI